MKARGVYDTRGFCHPTLVGILGSVRPVRLAICASVCARTPSLKLVVNRWVGFSFVSGRLSFRIYNDRTHGAYLRHETWSLRNPLSARRWRHGRSVSRRDTRLGRDVALKILPESFARDPDRLRRFEQEARAVAALNHPNILAVFDIGQQRWLAISRFRTSGGRKPARSSRQRRVAAAQDHRVWSADRARARGGARKGNRPPRSETGKYFHHQRRSHQDS